MMAKPDDTNASSEPKDGSASDANVTCTVVRQLAEWLADIEAVDKLGTTPKTEFEKGYELYRKNAKLRIQAILDANSETRHEAGMPIS